MVTLFHDMMHKEVKVYVDNMIAKSRTPDQHVNDLRKLFERLQKYKLRLNPAKCTFGVKTKKLLRFIVNKKGIEVDLDKVKAIRNMPTLRIETEECHEAFEKVKQYLETPLVLVLAVLGKPLILYLSMLEELMEIHGLETKVPGTRTNLLRYSLDNKEVETIHAIPHQMAHRQNGPSQVYLRKPALTRWIARWQMALSKYDIVYISQKAIKGSTITEQLAHHPLADLQLLLHEFLYEHIMVVEDTEAEIESSEWKLWFDEASNLLGNGIGVVLSSPEGQCFPFSARLGFDYTNNMVEYEACAVGILMAIEHQAKKLKVFGDSALVIYQLCEEWEMHDPKLIPYHDYITETSKYFDRITFYYVLGDENQTADTLATLSSMLRVNKGQEITIHGATQNGKRTLRRLAADFFLSGPILYKRSADLTLLHCMDDQEAKEIIEEVHEGVFGTHANGHALARKILRVGYYWTKMESDCCQHVKRFRKCQVYANNMHVAPSPLHNLTSPWPFSLWGLDIIGPIEPKVSNEHRFILVAIAYFTKSIEATSHASVTKSIVIKFITRRLSREHLQPGRFYLGQAKTRPSKQSSPTRSKAQWHSTSAI
ncbi:Gypsy retrotransposon integrase-like protein 1, partial [Mucuna pruriens]